MTRRLITSGSSFERDVGYSRAVVDGEWVFVSGTTGFDHATMTIASDVEAQAEQCLRNIDAALAQAGARPPLHLVAPTRSEILPAPRGPRSLPP